MKAWVLQGDGACYGIYTSLDKLSKAVDYWMKTLPRQVLSYQEWTVNYIPEANSWDWCYVPLNTKMARLTRGGGTAPLRKYWGHNLLDLQSRGIEIFPEDVF